MAIIQSIQTLQQARDHLYNVGDMVRITFGSATDPTESGASHWFTYYNIIKEGHKDSVISIQVNPNPDGTYRGTLFNSTFILPLTTKDIEDLADNNVNFDNYNVIYDIDKKIFGTFPSGGGAFTPLAGGTPSTGGQAEVIHVHSTEEAKALDFSKYTQPFEVIVHYEDNYANYLFLTERLFTGESIVEFSVTGGFLTDFSNNLGTFGTITANALAALNTNGYLDGKVYTDVNTKTLRWFSGTEIKNFNTGSVTPTETVVSIFEAPTIPTQASATGAELVGDHPFTYNVAVFGNIIKMEGFIKGINGNALQFTVDKPTADGKQSGTFSLTQEQVTALINSKAKIIETYIQAEIKRDHESQPGVTSNRLETVLGITTTLTSFAFNPELPEPSTMEDLVGSHPLVATATDYKEITRLTVLMNGITATNGITPPTSNSISATQTFSEGDIYAGLSVDSTKIVFQLEANDTIKSNSVTVNISKLIPKIDDFAFNPELPNPSTEEQFVGSHPLTATISNYEEVTKLTITLNGITATNALPVPTSGSISDTAIITSADVTSALAVDASKISFRLKMNDKYGSNFIIISEANAPVLTSLVFNPTLPARIESGSDLVGGHPFTATATRYEGITKLQLELNGKAIRSDLSLPTSGALSYSPVIILDDVNAALAVDPTKIVIDLVANDTIKSNSFTLEVGIPALYRLQFTDPLPATVPDPNDLVGDHPFTALAHDYQDIKNLDFHLNGVGLPVGIPDPTSENISGTVSFSAADIANGIAVDSGKIDITLQADGDVVSNVITVEIVKPTPTLTDLKFDPALLNPFESADQLVGDHPFTATVTNYEEITSLEFQLNGIKATNTVTIPTSGTITDTQSFTLSDINNALAAEPDKVDIILVANSEFKSNVVSLSKGNNPLVTNFEFDPLLPIAVGGAHDIQGSRPFTVDIANFASVTKLEFRMNGTLTDNALPLPTSRSYSHTQVITGDDITRSGKVRTDRITIEIIANDKFVSNLVVISVTGFVLSNFVFTPPWGTLPPVGDLLKYRTFTLDIDNPNNFGFGTLSLNGLLYTNSPEIKVYPPNFSPVKGKVFCEYQLSEKQFLDITDVDPYAVDILIVGEAITKEIIHSPTYSVVFKTGQVGYFNNESVLDLMDTDRFTSIPSASNGVFVQEVPSIEGDTDLIVAIEEGYKLTNTIGALDTDHFELFTKDDDLIDGYVIYRYSGQFNTGSQFGFQYTIIEDK